MAAPGTVYTDADWATREYFAPKVQDVVFNSNATTAVLRKTMRTVSGGTHIDSFYNYKKSTQGGWFTRSDTHTQAFEQKFDAARWQWKLLQEPVALFMQDILENEGSEQRRFDLVMHENMAAAKAMADNFGSALFSLNDYTNTDKIDSLDLAIAAGTTVYAGVTRATSGDGLLWAANVDSSSTTLNLSVLNDLYLDCSEGTDQPNLIVSNNKAFGLYYDELTPIQRQQSDELLGQAGFTSLLFNGKPWIIDSHVNSTDRSVPASGDVANNGTPVASEYVYMMNTNYMEIVAHRSAAFTWSNVMQPIDQWAVVGRYYFMGNVPVYNPRFFGKLTAITA